MTNCSGVHQVPAILPGVSEGDKYCHGGQEWYRVSIQHLGNGHAEASITPYSTLNEPPIWFGQPDPNPDPPDEEANRKRAMRRAKSQVRKKCKVMGVDSLWTLTYKTNMQDEVLLLKHWDAFRRRCGELFPGWAYVATVEKQQRGALHIHIATHRLPATIRHNGKLVDTKGMRIKSWDVMRAIWRSVTKEHGGNFDEKKRAFHSKSKAHKIAKYIAKYVGKAFGEYGDGDKGKKRFWVSQGIEVPKAQVRLFKQGSLADLIALVHTMMAGPGECAISTFFNRDRSVFWMSTEDEKPG